FRSWGLAAFSPRALRASGYAAFIEMLRAALADTGGLRIDHILGLARLWLVPRGATPAQGAYLRYPLEDLLRLVALEAWRHGALIVGENLGTVPAGFNDRLAQSGVLGTSVLWFQTASGPDPPPAFIPPAGRCARHAGYARSPHPARLVGRARPGLARAARRHAGRRRPPGPAARARRAVGGPARGRAGARRASPAGSAGRGHAGFCRRH